MTHHTMSIDTNRRDQTASATCSCGWRSAGRYRKDLYESMALRALNLAARMHLDLAEPRGKDSRCGCGLDPKTAPCGSGDCVGLEIRDRYRQEIEYGRQEAEQVARGVYEAAQVHDGSGEPFA